MRNISAMTLERLKELDSKVLTADEFVQLILRNDVCRYVRAPGEIPFLLFKIEFFDKTEIDVYVD